MAAESQTLWIIFFALLAYAVFCQIAVVSRLVQAKVPVPWLTLAVPLHLFQRCRDARAVLGEKLQWWGLSADVAVLACLGLLVAAWSQHG